MKIKDGDYFSYSWKIGKGPKSDPYWCRDGRCVARTDAEGDIWLIDTYNYWPYKDGKEETDIFTYEGLDREYSKRVNNDPVDLTFICNLNNYEFIHEYAKDDYEGVVFVGYQCTKKWAKPKGSEISNSALKQKYLKQYQEALYDRKNAENRIANLDGELSRLALLESDK